MGKKSVNWLVIVFISIIALAGICFLISPSITGAYSNYICTKEYSPVSGMYHTSCYHKDWIENPEFDKTIRVDIFQPNPIQTKNQFDIKLWQKRYYPLETQKPIYKGTPYEINYKDSKIGSWDREKWLKRHGFGVSK